MTDNCKVVKAGIWLVVMEATSLVSMATTCKVVKAATWAVVIAATWSLDNDTT